MWTATKMPKGYSWTRVLTLSLPSHSSRWDTTNKSCQRFSLVRWASRLFGWLELRLLSRLQMKWVGGIAFFWTKLRASLQQWQSLSCARIVIVRQRDQKERSGTMKDKANQPPNNKQQKPPVPDQSSKRWNKLRLSRQSTIPGSHNVFSRK